MKIKSYTSFYFLLICFLVLVLAVISCKPEQPQSTDLTESFSSDSITSDTIPGTAHALPPDTAVHSQLSDTVTMMKTSEKTNRDTVKKQKPLTVIVTNLASPDGPIVIGFYSPDRKFLDEHDQLKEYRIKPKKGKFEVKLNDLPYGIYAAAIYQDVNSNGVIDKTLGIPKEPYAFSNNYHPRIHAPSFDDCKFTYDANTTVVRMALIK